MPGERLILVVLVVFLCIDEQKDESEKYLPNEGKRHEVTYSEFGNGISCN